MAIVRISPTAWMKIQALVVGYDKEVAWYATVEKIGIGEYRMKDILVYPQIASGAFVEDTFINGDPTEMNEWMDSLPDEQFLERRGQGHSHVEMSVSPSPTDKEFWKRFALSVQNAPNPYVVTMIINKKLDMMWWIVDWEDKQEYTNAAIEVLIEVEEGVSNIDFFAASKELVRDRTTKPSSFYLFGGNAKSQSINGSFIFAQKTYGGGSYNQYSKQLQEDKTAPKKEEKKTVVQNSFFDDEYEQFWNQQENACLPDPSSTDGSDECLKHIITVRDSGTDICPAVTIIPTYWDIIAVDSFYNDYAINWHAKANGSSNVMASLNSVCSIIYDAFFEDPTLDYFEIVNDKDEVIVLKTAEDIRTVFAMEAKDHEIINLVGDDGVAERVLTIAISTEEENKDERK